MRAIKRDMYANTSSDYIKGACRDLQENLGQINISIIYTTYITPIPLFPYKAYITLPNLHYQILQIYLDVT